MIVLCNPSNSRRFRVNLDFSRTEIPTEFKLTPTDREITWDDYSELLQQYLATNGVHK